VSLRLQNFIASLVILGGTFLLFFGYGLLLSLVIP
jgi:hypothetical protein